MIKQETIEKAFEFLENKLEDLEAIDKASENDLDQPEGADMGWGQNANPKMSSEANDDGGSNSEDEAGERKGKSSKKKSATKSETGGEDDMNELKNKSLNADEEVQGKIEVSDFLKSFHDSMGDYLDAVKDATIKSIESNESRFGDLEEMVADTQQSLAKVGIVLKAICQQMRIIEDQPAREPKADTINKADGQFVERQFEENTTISGEQKNQFPGLHENPIIAKSQVTQILTDMVMKGEAADLDLIGFETGSYISPEVAPKLHAALALKAN